MRGPEAIAIETHAKGRPALGIERAVDRVDDHAHLAPFSDLKLAALLRDGE